MTYVFVATTAFLAYVLWSRTRRRRVFFELPRVDPVEMLRSMAALTWSYVTEGNRVTIVQDNEFFDALLRDFEAARRSIHLETFLWRDSAISDRVSAALSACAAAGLEVRVLVDQRGAKQTSPDVWRRMRDAGVDFRVYHRARFREFALYNHRDHRKIAVIDGRIGYTFGHGIDDMWAGTAEQPSGWRDTGARFEGPVVNALQSAFFDNWLPTAGRAVAGDAYFPRLSAAGTTPLLVAFLRPPETASAVQRLTYMAIAGAQREIIVQNPYFIPDRQALALFTAAVRRGVKISITLPTAATSDFAIVQHASHYFYGPLLRLGVRVFEYTRSGLHQKVMIVDRAWFSIGSTNFDPRSFRINEEITVAGVDDNVAADLYAAYENDLRNTHEWTLQQWQERTLAHRIQDQWAALFKRQL